MSLSWPRDCQALFIKNRGTNVEGVNLTLEKLFTYRIVRVLPRYNPLCHCETYLGLCSG